MIIIDGKKIANEIKQELLIEVKKLSDLKITPKLVIIQVGNNLASNVYVASKHKLSLELNTTTEIIKLSESTTTKEIINVISLLNSNESVNGILVQLPLPKLIDEELIIDSISPTKDVDCFNNKNVGLLWNSRKKQVVLKPCTPNGILEMIKRMNIKIESANVVIVGRSNIVGKPLAALFLSENATVTVCHSKTKDLEQICSKADILVAAIGQTKFIKSNFIKQDAVIIDVGMNRDENNKLCGDVDFLNACQKSSYITPVPGGVGPMTVIMLMKNLINLTKIQRGIKW